MIGLYQRKFEVSRDPWTGAAPSVPKLVSAKANPARALE